ncbi:hypothetical protein SLEP1_g12545 [Rubroshorea leprosula]|uniref:Uncharacterized protein n=1 Tax=Rubroshorea leprosula TaxID=152421 RepID=A0AAV5ICW1_9ROSI|nr:hypothetical protein SLEP1_g12545 [Rubroshorea leprosula]
MFLRPLEDGQPSTLQEIQGYFSKCCVFSSYVLGAG